MKGHAGRATSLRRLSGANLSVTLTSASRPAEDVKLWLEANGYQSVRQFERDLTFAAVPPVSFRLRPQTSLGRQCPEVPAVMTGLGYRQPLRWRTGTAASDPVQTFVSTTNQGTIVGDLHRRGPMRTIGREDAPTRSSIRKVAFASFIGTAIEWYDFYLYGTSAALVFPRLFFPELSVFAATLASFATFGVAFFTRPLGGIIFGHYGDRIGRKSMLVITLLLMGGATFLIGLVPTYAQAGILAPSLL